MISLTAALSLSLALAPAASPDLPSGPAVLKVGEPLARFDRLKPSSRLYVRYTIKGEQRSAIDIWRRAVSYEVKDGRRLLHIHQRWDRIGAPASVVEQDSWFEPSTFRPLTHERKVVRDGATEVGGYRFLADRIVGDPDTPNNKRADFVQLAPEPAYNFETDMETFQALPLTKGYVAEINFYDPGLAPPKHYRFSVVGEDTIPTPDGRKVDCWVLASDYGHPEKGATRFWFAKSTQVMVREEQPTPDGAILIKSLLQEEPSDRAA